MRLDAGKKIQKEGCAFVYVIYFCVCMCAQKGHQPCKLIKVNGESRAWK